jgi:hypothetical protein
MLAKLESHEDFLEVALEPSFAEGEGARLGEVWEQAWTGHWDIGAGSLDVPVQGMGGSLEQKGSTPRA